MLQTAPSVARTYLKVRWSRSTKGHNTAKSVTLGLDIAKSVFQVHGVDAAGQVVVRRQLRRYHVLKFFAALAPCIVGIEACATSH